MSDHDERRSSLDTLEIRLLCLLPEGSFQCELKNCCSVRSDTGPVSQQDSVHCRLKSTFLSSAPPYRALSYTWGDPNVREPIVIDGRMVQVTTNLHLALRQLRKGLSSPLNLWVDAVCIDQSNDKEKTEQVQHMDKVYIRAESVITFLGPASSDGRSDIAMRWMQRFGEQACRLRIGETRDLHLGRLLATVNDRETAEADELSLFLRSLMASLDREQNAHYDDLIAGLQDVLKRSYWSRVWIVQEVALATKVGFICGDEEVSEDALHHALRLLRNFRLWQLLRIGQETTNKLNLVREDSGIRARVIQTDPSRAIELLKIRRAAGPSTMIYLLRRLQNSLSTDPRDRVFALLGIATDAKSLGLRVDYTKSVHQVYTELARVLVHHGCSDILSRSHIGEGSLQVPSWVPDWTSKKTRAPFQQRAVDRSTKPATRTVLQPEFSAGGHPDQLRNPSEIVGHWESPMHLTFIKIGEVAELGTQWKTEDVGGWLHSLQQLVRSPLSLLAEPSQQTEALWRTAAADQDMRQHTVKPRLSDTTIQKLDQAFAGMQLDSLDSQALVDQDLGSYVEQIHTVGKGRRPFLTSLGSLAIGPQEAQLDDHIVVILGAGVPFVLRRRESGGYHLIGEAYVFGNMDGEVLRQGSKPVTLMLH